MLIKGTRYYNRNNACDTCNIDLKVAKGHPYREYNNEGNWTGRWLCYSCYMRDYHRRPGTEHSLKKMMRDRRTGNLDPNSSQSKGDKFEELTCKWRRVDNLNVLNDNYSSPIDHSRDPEFGIIQTMGRLYNTIYGRWGFTCRNLYGKSFDCVICYCTDKFGRNIERIYIFPFEDVVDRQGITITRVPTNHRGGPTEPWYEKYRIKDEELLNMVNDIFMRL